MKKSKGFALLELMIALVIFGVVMQGVFAFANKKHFDNDVNSAIDKLVMELTMIQQYEAESPEPYASVTRFPETPADLVDKGYANECTATEVSAGKCQSVEKTYWGDSISYNRIDKDAANDIVMHLTLSYPLTTLPTEEANRVAGMFMGRVPFLTYDKPSKTMTVRVNRSSASAALEGFIDAEGNRKLEDDWDVGGNYSIANAKNVTVRTQDGKQMNLAASVISSFPVANGTSVPKPSCPAGLKPAISTSVKSIAGYNMRELGAINTYYTETSSAWKVYLRYYAVRQSDDAWVQLSNGEINVNVSCITN
ncbi:prepilin-type N-terminal cleavage/methylation domain-containing protein [Vibrio gangliei]|uniref:prepilin-type N-terminal cleavage/methylation domain-containing protein n=1 Tax=Vibrio gangliei TaxID=2077090 RepID=UPI0013006C91|nr:prepilin-type N-terminal cleavage/methylation domain-containing protein [Vibrio gangliei]